jgi:hypothetical protein
VPNIPLGRKRTHTLVERTPGKPPTPPRAAPALDLTGPDYLPPSTAPAVLYKGKGREGVQEDNQGGRIKGQGLFAGVATSRIGTCERA